MAPVVHPGRLLKREMAARKLSANRLSLDIGVPSGRITDILNGRRGITADTAVRLGRYFGNSAQFWLDLQGQYDIGMVEREKGAENCPARQAGGCRAWYAFIGLVWCQGWRIWRDLLRGRPTWLGDRFHLKDVPVMFQRCVSHCKRPERAEATGGAGAWPQDEIERSICRRRISGASGSSHRASTTGRPIRSACLSCTMTSS
jgi:addiction module HigA family antidote